MEKLIVKKAEKITTEFLEEKVKGTYQIIGKGSVNYVCVVETVNRKVVVRMNVEESYSEYVKEKWCIEQAKAVGIPSPHVLSIGKSNGTAYMIQSFIEGDNGLESSKPKLDIWRQLGNYSRLLQSIPVRGFGENLIEPVQGVFQSPPHAGSDGSWHGFLNYNINCLTENDPLLKLGVIDMKHSSFIKEMFEALKQANFYFGLNHGDLSLKNTIITPEGQVVLLDWGSAEVNVAPHSDIIELIRGKMLNNDPNEEEFQAFLDGFRANAKELVGLKALLLLRAFDKLRWALEKSPDNIVPFANYAKKVVKLTIDQI